MPPAGLLRLDKAEEARVRSAESPCGDPVAMDGSALPRCSCAGAAAPDTLDDVKRDWDLPAAAWEHIADHLTCEDLLELRLVCSNWRRELGALVNYAVVVPSHQEWTRWKRAVAGGAASARGTRLPLPTDAAAGGGGGGGPPRRVLPGSIGRRPQRWVRTASSGALVPGPPGSEGLTADPTSSSGAARSTGSGGPPSVVGRAFPFLEYAYIAVDSEEEQNAAPAVLAALVDASRREALSLELDAVARSFHVAASQELPALRSRTRFAHLPALAARLTPPVLARVTTVWLDSFPEDPAGWKALSALPALRALMLPPFKPAVSHSHLPAIATLTGLDTLALSVQGSFTQWRANNEAFESLSALTALTSLSLHAFHAANGALSSALSRLTKLRSLHLSGRVVVTPADRLVGLSQLEHIDITQDLGESEVMALGTSLSKLTHLRFGRLVPRGDTDGDTSAGDANANGGDAAAAAAGAGAAAGLAAGLLAGGGAGGVVGAIGVGGGDNLLADLANVVDGLVANMQGMEIPDHLQRVIERFEMIMQVDMARQSCGSSTWSAPTGSEMLSGGIGGYPSSNAPRSNSLTAAAAAANRAPSSGIGGGTVMNSRIDNSASAVNRGVDANNVGGGGVYDVISGCAQLGVFELLLQRREDLGRLQALAAGGLLRGVWHMGLRVRDHLLGYASVAPLALTPTHVSLLTSSAAHAPGLVSLSLSGKVEVSGDALAALLGGLPRLRALALDVHFSGVGPSAAAKLRELSRLEALVVRHRGAGKLPLALAHLPPSLTSLAVKKVFLTVEDPSVAAAKRRAEQEQQRLRQQQQEEEEQRLRLQQEQADTLMAVARPGVLGDHQQQDEGEDGGNQRDAEWGSSGIAVAGGGGREEGGLPPLPQGQQQPPHWRSVRVPSPVPPAQCGGDSGTGPSHAVDSPWFHGAPRYNRTTPSPEPPGQSPDSSEAAACADTGPSTGLTAGAMASRPPPSPLPSVPAAPAAALDASSTLITETLTTAPCLSGLRSLFLHTSLAEAAVASSVVLCATQMTQLALTAPESAPSEEIEMWLAQLGRMRALQVLDLSVPDSWRTTPTRLRDTLERLPRLRHLHLSLTGGPPQLEALGLLTRLKTLAADYAGPPALRPGLQARLEAALPATKVQIWEQLRARHPGPDGSGDSARGGWLRRWAACLLVAAGGAAIVACAVVRISRGRVRVRLQQSRGARTAAR